MGKGFFKFWYSIFFLIIFVNLVFLNMWVMGYVKPLYQAAKNENSTTISVQTQVTEGVPCSTDCVEEIYDAIYQATSSAFAELGNDTLTVQGSSLSQNSSREYSIPLGTGTNSTTTWTNVPGVASYINSGSYGTIQSVTFQAALYIPTGNQTAYVQLYNVTAGHPVWFSTMSMSGGAPQLLISAPITLDPGNNLYQVQMMSQLGYSTNLVSSTVNILGN